MADPFQPFPFEDSPPEIDFTAVDVPEPPLDYTRIRRWLETEVTQRAGQLGQLQYIFCSDAYLHNLNVDFLQHDTLTDIITFPYASFPLIAGDLFISTERVAENASERQLAFEQELTRVMVHGVLHLAGQGDKTAEEAQQMRQLEDAALDRLAQMV